jgi:hypothetical protein
MQGRLWAIAASVALGVGVIVVACGGKAVVDGSSTEGGSGGTAGSTSHSTTSSSGSTSTGAGGSGGLCASLEEELGMLVEEAQRCDALINALQCTGNTVVYDACGCALVANDYASDIAASSVVVYEHWTGLGCGPHDCEHCPPSPSSPWYCDPTTDACLPAYE